MAYIWDEQIIPLPNATYRMNNTTSVIRSRMESGRFRQRKRYNNEVELARLTFDLLSGEYASFKAIWKYEINNGSDWFMIRLPVGDGFNLTLVEVRFVGDYTANHRPHSNWTVSCPIEFRVSNAIPEEQWEDVKYIVGIGETEEFITATNIMLEEMTHMNAQHPSQPIPGV